MSQTPRFAKPKVQQLPNDLVELVSACQRLPSEHRKEIDSILARVVDGTKRRRRILSLVQDALSQLRMDMKYLMFDLEATRRERDEYRIKLDEQES
ncbi:MAG: transcriptional regulator [Planctomycetes bacterium]|nr:transcriptional regulator [Planctomycetota bacterium]